MTNLSPSLLLRKIQPPRQRGQKFLNHKAKKITAGGKPYALRYNRIKRTKVGADAFYPPVRLSVISTGR